MKKVFKLEDLDCAHCAAKMEAALQKLDGVSFANVNFISQKLTLETADERFDDCLARAVKACKKIEPDCRIVL